MFEKRTDLALEKRELHGNEPRIDIEEEIKNNIKITRADESGGNRYITLEAGRLWRLSREEFSGLVNILSDEIKSLLPKGNITTLVVGLGNSSITPDSLGPITVKNLLVTRHISDLDPKLFESAGFGNVAAVAPGVLGQTGIETAEIIKSICDKIKPDCVIIIDSLASRRLNRLATTVQLSNAGISPGSGVDNRRPRLDKSALGCEVISVGVPMVVDCATLAYDILEENASLDSSVLEVVVEKLIKSSAGNMFVTPKDNDIIARDTAKVLSTAMNIALHNMGINEIDEFDLS